LDLAAHEPLVEDPVSITFDEDGHLFAVEMRGYSERRDDNRGQIRMLFDDDDDGTFDRSTIFAKGLAWPTGLVCSQGGVFVVATPDLIWFKDTDGDGVADEKKVVFTGFGEGVTRLNVQGLPNSLQWGPDNRIWGSAGTQGGKIRRPEQSSKEAVNISGSDFSFDPKTLDFRAENGRAQYGLSFDSSGRRFLSSNSNHIIAVMWEKGWTKPSPWYSLPRALASIATDGGAAPVFRISPDEPWRIVRTRWRVSGVVRGMVEGGGRVSGYFTGASGVTIYTGDALGPAYRDNAFTGDVGSNLVHRKIVSNQAGLVALRADRPKDEAEREFIASTDNWFRPTTYTNGPDGCFYISDMYREVIEHPWSLPEGIKKHLDLNSGTDRGRIYRVRPEEFQRRGTQKLSSFDNDKLAELLDHSNGWHRATAQRLLWERGDERAGSGWGLGAKAGSLDATFRETLALARGSSEGKVEKLAASLADSPKDTWMTAAVMNAIGNDREAADLFVRLSEDGFSKKSYLLPLVQIIGKMNKPEAVELVLVKAAENSDSPETVSILESLGSGLASSRSSLIKADQKGILGPVFSSALATAVDPDGDVNKRIAAIRLSAFSPSKDVDGKLEQILSSPGNDKLYSPVIDSLKKRRSKSLATLLTESWEMYPAAVKSSALQVLLESPTRSACLLKAIQDEKIAKSVLNPGQINLLRGSKDAGIKKQVAAIYPVEKKIPRSEIVAKYQSVLKLNGDP
jgi:putative membrane-bound dehydrogenase-like protein